MSAAVDTGDEPGLLPDVETLVSDLQATIGVMRHLTCSSLQVTDSEWSVVVGCAGQIADTLYEVWRRGWATEREEQRVLHEELAAAKAQRGAPGSADDRNAADALWVLLRSAGTVIMQQTGARLATAAEPSPDAELIRLCDRLVEIDAEERRLQHEIPNDEEREPAEEPLHDEWVTIRARLYEIGRPATLEGAQAMAIAANANADGNQHGSVTAPDLADWLALAACAFLAGTPAPIPSAD